MPRVLVNAASRQDAVMMTNLRNLFYQWHMGKGHMHHDGTVWRSIEELRRAMAWSTPHVEMRWENLGLVQPNWCCSRCLRRGAAPPDHYVTREGAMRMLMEQPQECEGFWEEILPCLFDEDNQEEPDRRLQVYSVVVATADQGRICPEQLFAFKEECAEKGWVRHIVGPYKESDYFRTPEIAELARVLIKARKWTSI